MALEPGHSVLDVGSGSGYLTMLAAQLVGESGSAIGVDVRPCRLHLLVQITSACCSPSSFAEPHQLAVCLAYSTRRAHQLQGRLM